MRRPKRWAGPIWAVTALLLAPTGGLAVGRDGSGATPGASGLAGQIAFAHEGDVWVMNAHGSDRTRLTDHPAEDFDPAWSPDGTRIAFRSHCDGNEEVYVMNADGSGQTNLTRNPREDESFPPGRPTVDTSSSRGTAACTFSTRRARPWPG